MVMPVARPFAGGRTGPLGCRHRRGLGQGAGEPLADRVHQGPRPGCCLWQSPRTRKQARPNVTTPTARAAGIAELEITVDSHERYAYRFTGRQVSTVRRALPCGDYGLVAGGRLIASVERKSRAALVADGLAELQVRWPNVPIVFCETRPLAEEWTYRFLAAAHAWAATEAAAIERLTPLAASAAATELAAAPGPPEPSTAEVLAWARATGLAVPVRGKLRPEVWAAWRAAHRP